MQVIDGDLVEYYEGCLDHLRGSGFHFLILALVREADAPAFYADLVRYWNSLDDLTADHTVFAVAGNSATERVGSGSIVGSGLYSERMALASRRNFNVDQLRALSGPRRRVEPVLDTVADANTAQITALCEHLGVSEDELPCLHITHMKARHGTTLPLCGAPGSTVYTQCKSLVKQLQPAIRDYAAAMQIDEGSELPDVSRDRRKLETECRSLATERARILARLAKPYDAGERDMLVSYFRQRLVERPAFTPTDISELITLCVRPDRSTDELPVAIKRLADLALIPRLSEKAHRMIKLAYGENVMRYDADAGDPALRLRLGALEREYEDCSRKARDLWGREQELLEQHRLRIDKLRGPADANLLAAFSALRPALPTIENTRWDFFVSYPKPDLDSALVVFRETEMVGSTFIDHHCLLPGHDWQRYLPEVQARSRATVVLLTHNSANAHFQVSEIQRAINLMRAGHHTVVPVYLHDKITPPFGLEQVHGVRGLNGDLTKLRSLLSAAVLTNLAPSRA